jgi:hypothetical protein
MPLQYTVPMLLDTVTRRVVCNESALIIRDFNSAFDELARFPSCNLRPPHLADAIDKLNNSMCVPMFFAAACISVSGCSPTRAACRYDAINDGVYRCGFAQSQTAYNEAVATSVPCVPFLLRISHCLSDWQLRWTPSSCCYLARFCALIHPPSPYGPTSLIACFIALPLRFTSPTRGLWFLEAF